MVIYKTTTEAMFNQVTGNIMTFMGIDRGAHVSWKSGNVVEISTCKKQLFKFIESLGKILVTVCMDVYLFKVAVEPTNQMSTKNNRGLSKIRITIILPSP